jgi:outer membrane protein TolC
VKVLREAVSSANALFRSGYAFYLEVIMTQKNVLDAELGLINAKREQYLALIDLYRSLGGVWK